MTNEELKPCANCCGSDSVESGQDGDFAGYVHCGNCGFNVHQKSEDEAIALWNEVYMNTRQPADNGAHTTEQAETALRNEGWGEELDAAQRKIDNGAVESVCPYKIHPSGCSMVGGCSCAAQMKPDIRGAALPERFNGADLRKALGRVPHKGILMDYICWLEDQRSNTQPDTLEALLEKVPAGRGIKLIRQIGHKEWECSLYSFSKNYLTGTGKTPVEALQNALREVVE